MSDKEITEVSDGAYPLFDAEIKEMNARINKIEQENAFLKDELFKTRYEFSQVTANGIGSVISPKKIKQFLRSTVAYIIGRRDRRQLYSKAYKKKKARNTMKSYSYYLYSLGFEEKMLQAFMQLYTTTKNHYEKKEAAWELLLWYANKNSIIGAAHALKFVHTAREKETDIDALRKIDILEIEALLRLERREDAERVLSSLMKRGKHSDQYFIAANLEMNIHNRINLINNCLQSYDLAEISLSDSQKATDYDRLQTVTAKKVEERQPLVTVIVPVFNAEKTISTTLDSLLAQTWRNLEIIVVDDASTDETIALVEHYVQANDRIILLQNTANSGPYVSRNKGLHHASGEFVTVNDADDWTHAQKIEIQAKHLLGNQTIMANMSQQARVYEDLAFTRRGVAGGYLFPNMSSLMFRRQVVLEKIGYWDRVRFAGDSEFINRLEQAFGKEKVIRLDTGPLSFTRQTKGSLTGNATFGYSGHLKGARKEYAEAFRFYHQHAKSLYLPLEQGERPFQVPMVMQSTNSRNKKQHFDVIVACDFRYPDNQLHQIVEEIKQVKRQHSHVALMQLDVLDFSIPKQINHRIRSLMEEMEIPMLVHGEKVSCEVILIRKTEVLLEKQSFLPEVNAGTVNLIFDQLFFNKLETRKNPINAMRRCSHNALSYFDKRSNWYPESHKAREVLKKRYPAVLKYIRLSKKDWYLTREMESFKPHLKNWIVPTEHEEYGEGVE
ncbi:glycosyltransferase family 2 protein [Oceanobacillus kapialis]|uniref:glycosyltransferase family 2 protein n=1 Tax=Oceanobacillus kapialis TaxID=481353 RepID=UPI00384B8525